MKVSSDLQKFLEKKFDGCEFTVTEYTQRGKDHMLTLDFGDDEVVEVTVRERKGDNGNYRVVTMG